MAVIYLERSVVDNLTEKQIKKIVDENSIGMKYSQLDDYYQGKHSILDHRKRDSTLPNNKIVNNMAKYITDTAVGYFIGQPVVYGSQNLDYYSAIQDIYDYNDEQDHNTELAKKCSICGHCYEMLYIDEDARIRFAKVDPGNLIMIYETGYNTPLAAIRTICSRDLDGNTVTKVEFWNWREVWYFRSVNSSALTLMDIQEHYWNDIPFVEYINNEERMGDFEGVITIIDAYNKVQSNTANLFQYNDEAILTVCGLGDVSSQDVRDMKEKGAIILENNGEIKWLLKVINDTALENYKDRLYKDMHIFSNVPNMADQSFGTNLSGVAVSYKLWNLEQICAIKERKFKKGLQRRAELITTILNLQGGNYDYRDMEQQFRRNKPQNVLELAQIFVMLVGEVSKETRLKLLPIIENVQDELEKLARERRDDLAEFGSYDQVIRALDDLKNMDDETISNTGQEVSA